MKKWLAPSVAARSLLFAAGCGAVEKGNSADSVTAQAPAPANVAGKQALPTGAADAGVNKEAAGKTPDGASNGAADRSNTATPGITPNNTAAPAKKPEAKPLYRMNKAYRFVPIDKTTAKKVVLLTFDDGPKEKIMLTSMLNTLDKHKAKAIFFVNGYRIKQNPDLLSLIHKRGQTIGNHSWDHIDLRKEKPETVAKQIGNVNRIVQQLTGEPPRFFRPPFGSGGDTVKSFVNKQHMLYMTWSNGSLDWDIKSTKKNPDLVVKSVLEQLHDGANILMHELPWTAEALDRLLTELEKKGYGFIDPATIEIPGSAPAAK